METIQLARSRTRTEPPGHGEKQSKKNSKWSIGGLFRRNKKKVNDTDSSSSSEHADKKSIPKRPHSLRKGHSRTRKDFTEHMRSRYPLGHASDIVRFEPRVCADSGECSRVDKCNETITKTQPKIGNFRQYRDSLLKGGHECKGRLDKSSNECLRVESSSDDPSESSGQRKGVKAVSRDGSISLRSRASRTERYRKRILRHEKSSKDNFNSQSLEISGPLRIPSEIRLNEKVISNNQWTADVVYCESSDYETKYTAKMKSASSSPMQSPKAKHKYVLCSNSSPTPSLNLAPTHPMVGVAMSSSDLSYSHSKPGYNNKQSQCSVNTIPPKLPKSSSNILFRHSPLSRSMLTQNEPNHNNVISSHQKEKMMQTPPPPPPRDPQRKVIFGYNNKGTLYSNLNNSINNVKQLNSGCPEFGSSDSAFRRFHIGPEYNQKNKAFNNDSSQISHHNHLKTTEKDEKCTTSLAYERYMAPNVEHNVINEYEGVALKTQSKSVLIQEPDQYNYLTDQPRCRKPIQIAYKPNQIPNERYLSNSQLGTTTDYHQGAQSSICSKSDEVLSSKDLWFLKDQKNSERICLSDDCSNTKQPDLPNTTAFDRVRLSSSVGNEYKNVTYPKDLNLAKDKYQSFSVSRCSDQIYISKLPDCERIIHDDMSIPPDSAMSEDKRDYEVQSPNPYESKTSPRPITLLPTNKTGIDSKLHTQSQLQNCDEQYENIKRNKKNVNSLEDALNELEAIYQSLKLDDDRYFENDSSSKIEHNRDISDYSNWNDLVHSAEIQSELNLNFGESKSPSAENIISSPNKRSNCRRPETPNTLTDDMAYRRLIKKEKIPSHEKEVISQAGSFLLVSPTLSPPPFFETASPLQVNKEPDITYDDVVYRNFQHTNKALKILDPQPPFGIPLLPVTQTPNSSYLCVNSKESFRPAFKPKKYPDLVADDLAFRNLRKDKYKEHLSKVKVDQDQSMKSMVGSALLIANKMNMKIGCKDYIAAPINRILSYNNNTEEDKFQSCGIIIDSSNVSGFVPKVQYAQPVILESILNCNVRCDEENSNTIPGISNDCVTEMSWPLSSQTLTESNISDFTQNSIQANSEAHTAKLPYLNSLKRFKPFNIEELDKKSDSQTSVGDTYKCESRFQNYTLAKQPCDNFHNLMGLEVSSKIPDIDCKEDDSDKINFTRENSIPRVLSNSHDLTITEDEEPGNKQPPNEDSTVGVDKGQGIGIDKSSDLCMVECSEECEKDSFLKDKFSTAHSSYTASSISYHATNHTEQADADALNENEECATDNLIPFYCSGKAINIPKMNVIPSNKDSGLMTSSYLPISDSLEEDQDQGQSRNTLCALISDEGTKENCVPACNQHAFLICMVWLHQLVSVDLVAVLSIILAVAALILIIIL